MRAPPPADKHRQLGGTQGCEGDTGKPPRSSLQQRGTTGHEQFCGMKAVEKPVKEISVKDLYDWQVKGEKFQLIDVREPHEYDIVNLGGELIPLATVSDNADRIEKDKKVVIHCKMGGRSAKAIRELEEKYGFNNLYNLRGGILAYIDEVKPELTKY